MTYWPWWLSGTVLAGVMVFHWFAVGRMMAVSGRFTSLVDRLRHGRQQPEAEMSQHELLAALQAATLDEFGGDEMVPSAEPDLDSPGDEAPIEPAEVDGPLLSTPRPFSEHFVFFCALVLGGGISRLLAGSWEPSLTLHGEGFAQLTAGLPASGAALLFAGGLLVGFGTRMAGGCTSGHGLCGVSRLQSGSLLATAAFFGAGIATSFALGAL